MTLRETESNEVHTCLEGRARWTHEVTRCTRRLCFFSLACDNSSWFRVLYTSPALAKEGALSTTPRMPCPQTSENVASVDLPTAAQMRWAARPHKKPEFAENAHCAVDQLFKKKRTKEPQATHSDIRMTKSVQAASTTHLVWRCSKLWSVGLNAVDTRALLPSLSCFQIHAS